VAITINKVPRLLGAALFLLQLARAWGEPALISAIRYIGIPKEIDASVKSSLGVREGEPFDPEKTQHSAERLREKLSDYRYPLASVRWEAHPRADIPNRVDVIFRVESGPRGTLKELVILGNRSVLTSDLEAVIVVRPPSSRWNLLKREVLIRLEELEQDRLALLEVYHRRGYAEAEIAQPRLEKIPGQDGFRLFWLIVNEGPVYWIGRIEIQGDVLLDRDRFRQIIPIKPGERYNSERIRHARESLEMFYKRNGYAFVNVNLVTEFRHNEQRTDLKFIVNAGLQQRLRHIVVSGNTVTKTRIIEREIDIRPGALFDPDSLSLAYQKINILPMFSSVNWQYKETPVAGEYDLYVSVQERKTGRLEFGYMYGQTEGNIFSLNVTEMNLSFKPPFRGDALMARLSVMGGSRLLRSDVDIINPRFRDSLWSVGNQLFYEDNEFVSEDYNQCLLGEQLVASYPIRRTQKIHTGYSALRYKLYDLSEGLRNDGGFDSKNLLTFWLAGWDWDTTDHMLRPSKGHRFRTDLRLYSRVLGGDTDAVHTHIRGSLFMNPIGDHVLSVSAGFMGVEEYGRSETVPAVLRIYLGGVDNLKGFAYRSVSPSDNQGRLVGGLGAWWCNAECLLAVSFRLGVAFYTDIGDVSDKSFGFSGKGPVSDWGIGLLIRADNFPVRCDIAFPIETYNNDSVNRPGKARLSFSAGYRF